MIEIGANDKIQHYKQLTEAAQNSAAILRREAEKWKERLTVVWAPAVEAIEAIKERCTTAW